MYTVLKTPGALSFDVKNAIDLVESYPLNSFDTTNLNDVQSLASFICYLDPHPTFAGHSLIYSRLMSEYNN